MVCFMSIINDRLIAALKSNKSFSQKGMSLATGISTGTINAWVVRGTAMSAEFVVPVCKYLGVSPEYLLGMDDESDISDPDKAKLLQIYEQLSPISRKMILAYGEGLLKGESLD